MVSFEMVIRCLVDMVGTCLHGSVYTLHCRGCLFYLRYKNSSSLYVKKKKKKGRWQSKAQGSNIFASTLILSVFAATVDYV